jgi:hypothetical protein
MKLQTHTEIQKIEACVLYIKLNNWLMAKQKNFCWMKNTLSCYYIPLILLVCVTLLTRLPVNTIPYHIIALVLRVLRKSHDQPENLGTIKSTFFFPTGCSAGPNSMCIIVLKHQHLLHCYYGQQFHFIRIISFLSRVTKHSMGLVCCVFIICINNCLSVTEYWRSFCFYGIFNKVLCSANMFCNLLLLCCSSSVPIITAVWRDPADIRDTAEMVLHWLRRIVSMNLLLEDMKICLDIARNKYQHNR